MSDSNNQESTMDGSMSVSPVPGQGYALHSGAVAPQIPPGAIGLPMIQYPIDDTMPVKAWVFEVQPSDQRPFKPLRPEDERKALEAINRHLPPSERIKITQPSHTGMEVADIPRPRFYPGTSHTGHEESLQSRQTLYRGTHLPLPSRSRNRRDRQGATKPPSSPKNITPVQAAARKGVKSMNWTETENQEKELAWRAELEGYGPVPIVPDLMVTRPDGETRHLQDPNLYVHRRDGGSIDYF